jgi:uncharacterized protein DUF397
MMIPQQQLAIAGPWHKSSHSGSGNNCVEVAPVAGGCAVRDSKDPHGARLAFAADAWKAFVADIKHGRYNDL